MQFSLKSIKNNEKIPPRREALPGGGGGWGGHFARLNFKTSGVGIYCRLFGFAVTVAISFYALSIFFGLCRLSDFTLAGPQESLFYSFP